MATNCSCGIKQQKLQYHCGGQIEAIMRACIMIVVLPVFAMFALVYTARTHDRTHAGFNCTVDCSGHEAGYTTPMPLSAWSVPMMTTIINEAATRDRGAADRGERGEAAGGFAQDLPLSDSGAWLTDVVLATTGTDWVHRTRLSRAGQPSIAPMLRTDTARVCQVYRCTTHRFAHQRVFQCRRQPRKLPE
jgi:hypothetical protein